MPKLRRSRAIFYNGIERNEDGEDITNAGRILTCVGILPDLSSAKQLALQALHQFKMTRKQFRADIGDSAIQIDMTMLRGSAELKEMQVKYLGCLDGTPYRDPSLVQCVAGVGAKMAMAIDCAMYDPIAVDLVAQSVNEILCIGARPCVFHCYMKYHKSFDSIATEILDEMQDVIQKAKCIFFLEQAPEKPSKYMLGVFDVVGHTVGCCEYGHELPRFDLINEGDLIIGVTANGLHCSGIDIIYDIMKQSNMDYFAKAPFSTENKTYGKHQEYSPIFIFLVEKNRCVLSTAFPTKMKKADIEF